VCERKFAVKTNPFGQPSERQRTVIRLLVERDSGAVPAVAHNSSDQHSPDQPRHRLSQNWDEQIY
jgi:hypothetical protein